MSSEPLSKVIFAETENAVSKTAAVTTVVAIAAFSASPFTAAQLAAAKYVIITAHTNNCNVLWDGQNATTTFGHAVIVGQSGIAFGGNAKINNLTVVSQTGTSNVTITLEY